MAREVTALAGWFGSNRMLAQHVGAAMEGCAWVGIPFAGGMSEVPHITARTMLVNDRHRHVINLARVVRDDRLRPELIRELRRQAFHPDELTEAQRRCMNREIELADGEMPEGIVSIAWATDYFVCCWMNRGGKAGIEGEFNGRPAVRWKSDGGDSNTRFRSAIRMLGTFSRHLRRCTFETMDAFDFLKRCFDLAENGIYCDPPFPKVGRRYKFNAGKRDVDEINWHARLRDAVERFERCRVVMRFYDHPLIRSLYSAERWTWKLLEGRKQNNESAPEVLLIRNGPSEGLFGPPSTDVLEGD